MERQRIVEATKGIGKPKVGGAFDLVDHDGKRFTNGDMTGKYALVGVTSFDLWMLLLVCHGLRGESNSR